MQCYLETSDLEACKLHVSRLLESKVSNPLNYYLAYCLALKMKDVDNGVGSESGVCSMTNWSMAARKALSALNRATDDGDQLLYACISKTLESGTTEQAANILLGLLDKYDFDPPKHISLPTLLRRVYLKTLTGPLGTNRPSDAPLDFT